jgi:hypothetical protein
VYKIPALKFFVPQSLLYVLSSPIGCKPNFYREPLLFYFDILSGAVSHRGLDDFHKPCAVKVELVVGQLAQSQCSSS